jgi:hypothetical protein
MTHHTCTAQCEGGPHDAVAEWGDSPSLLIAKLRRERDAGQLIISAQREALAEMERLVAEVRRAALREALLVVQCEAERYDPSEPYYERPVYSALMVVAGHIRALAGGGGK